MVHLLGNIALAVGALAFLTFVVLYQLTAPWQETRMGRHMMTFDLVVTVVLVYAFVATIWGPLPNRDWVRVAVYGAIATIGWWRVSLLIREQTDARRVARRAEQEYRDE